MNPNHHPVRSLVFRIVIGASACLALCGSVATSFATNWAERPNRITVHVAEPVEQPGPLIEREKEVRGDARSSALPLPIRHQHAPSPSLVLVEAPLPQPSIVAATAPGTDEDEDSPFFAFEPIGNLNADASIGIAGIDADVGPSDRPVNRMPSPKTIRMASHSRFRYRQPASPMGSVSAHQPLYFEDVNLERYGRSRNHHAQPILSGARFCFDAASLPYQMTLQPPRVKHRYPHAFEAGRFRYRESTALPWDRHASLAETIVILGLIAVIP